MDGLRIKLDNFYLFYLFCSRICRLLRNKNQFNINMKNQLFVIFADLMVEWMQQGMYMQQPVLLPLGRNGRVLIPIGAMPQLPAQPLFPVMNKVSGICPISLNQYTVQVIQTTLQVLQNTTKQVIRNETLTMQGANAHIHGEGPPQMRKLFIGGLSHETTDEQVRSDG